MGSLSRASYQSMAMDRASSQFRSTEAGTSGTDQNMLMETSNGGSRKKKNPQRLTRKDKAAMEGPGREQESARAMSQLKVKVPLNGEFIPAGEDEIAAPTMLSAVNINGKYNIEAHGIDEANEVTDRGGKRKRQRHEFRTAQGRDHESSKRARLNRSINKFMSQTALPSSSLITSDVGMEETNVNLLPGDEQEIFSSGTCPRTQIMLEPKPITQRLIGETDKKRSVFPIQPSDRLPSLVFDTPQRQNHPKERCNQSHFRVVSSDSAAQEQPNYPGQHSFSFMPHSNDFVGQMLNSLTYFFRQPLDPFIPIDPALINAPPLCIYTPLEKSGAVQHHEKTNQHQHTNAPAEATGDIDSHVDISSVRANQPEDMGGNQQHRDPPETEDLPHCLPPDSDSFDEWILNSEDSDESTSNTEARKTTTPPPLAKRSRPLGNKTQQGGKKPKDYNPSLDQIANRGGVWTQAEISSLDAFRDKYCEENLLSAFQFNALVQSCMRYDQEVTDLFNEAQVAFPYRTRMSVARFCRRRYHNFPARGTWTQSEDENLKQAVIAKGRSWKAVGEMINRFPEDCRDRYRNYHINAQNRNRESWTDAEILNLCRAVHDCMVKMKEHNQQAKSEKFVGREVPESEPESDEEVRDMRLINWQMVSDAMGPGGGRSRLQCSLKWAQLRMIDRENHMKRVNDAWRGSSVEDKNKRRKSSNANWRLKQALRTLGNTLKPGDRYDFLQAFATCKARDEGNIAWKSLGDQAFRSRWTTPERKAALQIFKSEIPDGNNMNYHDIVNRLLTRLMAESGDKLGERWDNEQDSDALRGSSPKVKDNTKIARNADWRVKRALRTLDNNLKPGDRYDFLEAFATCKARNEDSIIWKSLGDPAFRSRWTAPERRAALQIFKSEIPNGNIMNYRDIVNRQLTRLIAGSSQKLGERSEKEQDSDANAEMRSAEKSRRKGISEKRKEKDLVKNGRREGLPKEVEDEKVRRDKLVISRNVQEEVNDVHEAIEDEEILLRQLGIIDAAEVEMSNKDMSAEASNRKAQEGREALHLSVVATDDESRQDQPDEDLGFDTDDDSLFGNGDGSPEPAEATAHAGARETSFGEGIYAMPAVSGKAAADATQGDSSEEDTSDKVTDIPQTNALLLVDEASANDRLHDEVVDEDVITATSPLREASDSPPRSSTASADEESQPHGSDDDVRTDSDTDSLFGKPLTS